MEKSRFIVNKHWAYIYLKRRASFYFENHDFLMTPKERIIENTLIMPWILYLALTIVAGISTAFTLETSVHLFYLVYLFIGISVLFALNEFFLYKKTRPKFELYCTQEDTFLSYFANKVEPEITALVTDKEFQEEIAPLIGYNGQAKKLVQKYIYQIIDKKL